MAKVKSKVSFRVGRVKAYRRGKIWYLCYHEEGKRRPHDDRLLSLTVNSKRLPFDHWR